MVPYEAKAHGFFNYSRDKTVYQETIRKMEDFLRGLGYLPVKP